MTAQQFRPGELVDITIKGARVAPTQAEAMPAVLRFLHPGQPLDVRWSTVALDNPGVSVERVAPAEWPPRPGDLWRDKHDELWFVHSMPDGTPGEIMRTAGGSRWYHASASPDGYDQQLADNAPWKLERREGHEHRGPGTIRNHDPNDLSAGEE